jgi:hypothetical protein
MNIYSVEKLNMKKIILVKINMNEIIMARIKMVKQTMNK